MVDVTDIFPIGISMDSGLLNGNASIARLLTHFITNATWPAAAALDVSLPSLAESLAVLAGSTLVQSSTGAPFVEFFNYSSEGSILSAPGQTQWFNASIRAQQYASGGSQDYQKSFNLVLFSTVIINVIILVYFIIHKEWYTDFSEPTNLFGFAINSPPSEKLADCSCHGGGTRGEQFKHYWTFGNEGGHLYMESPDIGNYKDSPGLRRRSRVADGFEMIASPVFKVGKRFSRL